MTNVLVKVVGNITALFSQQPSKASQLTMKVIQFAKRYWPYILLATAIFAVVAGSAAYIADRNNK